jgi:hypothetical protein
VIHGAEYVNDEIVGKLGRLGRSQGCPALSPAAARRIIPLIRDGTVLFAYYPPRAAAGAPPSNRRWTQRMKGYSLRLSGASTAHAHACCGFRHSNATDGGLWRPQRRQRHARDGALFPERSRSRNSSGFFCGTQSWHPRRATRSPGASRSRETRCWCAPIPPGGRRWPIPAAGNCT